jgi:hypothetical protein
VYLSDSLAALVKASGLPLGELVRRGLDRSSELEDTLRRVLREELHAMHGTDHTAPAVIAEPSPQPEHDSTQRACRHPASQVHEGLCTDCGTWL